MKLAFATPTPEIKAPLPVALFSGSLSERLQKAARAGYDGVELMVARPAEVEPTGIRAQVARAGLDVAAVSSGAIPMVDGLTLLAADAEARQRAVERLAQLVDLAAALAAPLVTIGGFRGRLAWGGAGAREDLIGILRQAADRAAGRGVRIVLEPMNRYESDVVNNTAEALALFAEVGHGNLGLVLDTVHANIEEPSMTGCLRLAVAAGRLWHVHLGDSNRLPPGQGHVDFAAIVATLEEVGYDGYLSAELLPRPDADGAGEATIVHMRRLLARQGNG